MAKGYFRNWEVHGEGFATAPKRTRRCNCCGANVKIKDYESHLIQCYTKKGYQIPSFLKNEKAQAAGIIMFIVFIFAAGFFYILLSGILQPYVDAFNQVIGNTSMHVSQDNKDMMDTIFRYWWALPIFFLILAVIYGIKNALSETTQEAY